MPINHDEDRAPQMRRRFATPPLARRVLRLGGYALRLLFAVVLLVLAAQLVFRPDPRDNMRAADSLFIGGHYYAALQRYSSLAAQNTSAELALRLGIVRTLRGEYALAERLLRQAIQSGLSGPTHRLALLYLGHVLVARGQDVGGIQIWALLDSCAPPPEGCAYSGPQRILRAELSLRREEYASAEADYRAARGAALPADWNRLVAYRLALLQSARDPDAALDLLAAPLPTSAAHDPWLQPLLPTLSSDATQLQAVLNAEPETRPQLLGQLLLDQNLYRLAEAQFTQITPDNPNALAAAAYAAYTRWRAGDQRRGLERLEELVAAHQDEPWARTLLALAYLSTNDTAAAEDQLATIRTLAPSDPDTHLAWANWYVAQGDYVNANIEYQQALAQVPPADRGRYALLIARFHLNSTYEQCELGLPAAEMAARALPSSADAWTILAAHRYHCGNVEGAVAAARTALDQAPGAAAAFYLGAALVAEGEWEDARTSLVRAADLAPASIWRERAEATLAQLP